MPAAIRLVPWLVCAGAVVLAASCGDEAPGTLAATTTTGSGGVGGGGGTGGGGGGAISDECSAYGEAVCDKLESCVPTYVRVAYGDPTRCAYRQALLCELTLAAPGSSFTPEQAGVCAEGYASLGCGSLLADLASACPIGAGAVADGEPCISAWQCASGSCSITEADGCGSCVPTVAAGQPCDGVAGACALGTGCAGGSCQPLASEGASCAAGEPCDLFLGCVNGICSFGSGPGAACDQANPCDFWNQGLFCSAAATCDPAALVGSGEACGDVGGVFSPCAASGKCSMQSNTCVPPAEDGAACGGPSEIGCYEPRRCIDGSCQLPDVAHCGMAPGAGGAAGAGGN